jgi:tetratricopeptide (TPR) repeat protein
VSKSRRQIPALILVVGTGLLYPIERWIDAKSPREAAPDESLYLSSGETIKKMSLGLNGLAADVYWIRTVQYFGRKLIESGKPITAGSTKDISMPLLARLLNIVVTLDPQHIPAYRFGAIFLPERDMPAAIALAEKGIRENRDDWRLYQDLAYIYWQAGNTSTGQEQIDDYAKAAEWYRKGSEVPGAPWWMRDLAGLMMLRGGSREAARFVYSKYLDSDDPNIRAQASDRLKQIRSLDELDAINDILSLYKQESGICPPDLRGLASKFRAVNLPLNDQSMPIDPEGFAYAYDPAKCMAGLAQESTVPR